MLKTPIARAVALATLGASLTIPTMAHAEFIKDSKAGLELRNFYYNNDFRDPASATSRGQSKQEEWAQGFLLRFESGFTEGTVGFGLDAMGLLGVKLDGGGGSGGTGLLPADLSSVNAAQRKAGSQDDYSHITYAAKARISKSTLKVGDLQLKNMAIASSDSRLLPQTFQGGQLNSMEIAGLTLDAGYLNRVNNRDSTNNQDIILSNVSGTNASGIRMNSGRQNLTDEFQFVGGTYKVMDNLTAAYYYSNLEEMYKQHSFNVVHVLPLADKQSLKTDLRYARSKDDGSTNIDNKAFGAMVTYALSGHSFGLGYQQMNGDTGFAYVGGTDPFLVNYVQVGHFGNREEKSWQARYDFNFASVGIPGLTFMTRYLTGDNIELGAGVAEGKEWERNTDIAYVFQNGALKNLGIRWRNATMRTNLPGVRDVDQNRLIVSYTLPLM
ncbi:outer membrane porin, OprD family [Stutzerimonas nosocomialis]|uniref:Outer membrane porin, OprD family n=1 Tax=Stutzerimonas nosocomialis TaxID=1056496 RepID=A0A5R9QHD4_9GAMM|nr:OprD family porin [Stutzerimonas nosocomialis]TLX60178.1 outer membrane porin, OprD family [Stutzerimonas nosocomialis]TLX64637.1 outer membrane porin, OprD family [Stutzerimonas nosocomialis]